MKECSIKNIGRFLLSEDVRWFVYSYYFECKLTAVDFIDLINKNGIINFLKINQLYKITGARDSKKTLIDESLERFIILKNNAKEFADSLINVSDINIHSTQIKYQRNEQAYLELLGKILNDICDYEYQYTVLDYRIDFYLPKYKIAVEFDEAFHFQDKKQIDLDLKRQIEIESFLDCTFFRIDERKPVLPQIDSIAKTIIKKITNFEPNLTGRFITTSCIDTILGIVTNFELYFQERNKAAIGKDILLNISFHDKFKIEDLEEKMSFAIDMNYITSFDMLLSELRKIYKSTNLKSIEQ
jgi:very-short-patch-repair endonuclease